MPIIIRIREFFNMDKRHISAEPQFANEVGLYQNGLNRVPAKSYGNGNGCIITRHEQYPEPLYHQHTDTHIVDSIPVVHHHGY